MEVGTASLVSGNSYSSPAILGGRTVDASALISSSELEEPSSKRLNGNSFSSLKHIIAMKPNLAKAIFLCE